MSAFKMRRLKLLIILVVISGLCLWAPWAGLSLQAKALRFGGDVENSFATLVEFESTVAVIRSADNDLEKGWKAVKNALEGYWGVELVEINPENFTITVDVGGNLSQEYLTRILGGAGEVLEVRQGLASPMREKISAVLFQRLDPYRMGGVSMRWVGDNVLLIYGVDGVKHETRIIREGRLDIYVEDLPTLSMKDISSVGRASAVDSLGRVAVAFTEEGLSKFNSHVSGREGDMLVFYLDMPFDAIFVYNGNKMSFNGFSYDENSFRLYDNDRNYPVAPPVLRYTEEGGLPAGAMDFLVNSRSEKRRLILLGSPRDNWPSFEDLPSYTIEFLEPKEGEEADNVVRRATGLVSAIMISADIAENGLRGGGLYIPVGRGIQVARDFKSVVINRLPARAKIIETALADPSLERGFLSKAFLSGVAGIFAISLLFGRLYRRPRVAQVFFFIMGSELLLLLGAISLAGIVVGEVEVLSILLFTGVEAGYLLSLTSEMVGEAPVEKEANIGWRIEKAMGSASYSSFLAVISLLLIGWLGPPAIWPVAFILGVGIIISVLLVKPSYCSLLARVYSGGIKS